MISIAQAFEHYKTHVHAVGTEWLGVEAAVRRTLAADALSACDLPAHTQSAMDGYAVRSTDLRSASPTAPVDLALLGESAAGGPPPAVSQQQPGVVRISTGAMLPDGFDAVVRQEEAQVIAGMIRFVACVAKGTDVRVQGEEAAIGHAICVVGERINAGHVAALAAAGVQEVCSWKLPRVALVTSGNEVVPAGAARTAGQVYDSNTPLIAAFLGQWGIKPLLFCVRDNLDATRSALETALKQADLVLTTGGVSVGDHDHVLPAARALGMTVHFAGVAQKPGKPLMFASRGSQVLLGLPGNPGAVFTCLHVHLEAVLSAFCGQARAAAQNACVVEEVRCDAHRDAFLQCSMRTDGEGRLWLKPIGGQQSHFAISFGRCQALAHIPASARNLASGAVVSFFWVRGGFS